MHTVAGDHVGRGAVQRVTTVCSARGRLLLDVHGHDHVDQAVVPHRFEDARPRRVGGLQRHLLGADDVEHVYQVAAVEGYLHLFPFDGGVQLTYVLAHLRRGFDDQPAGCRFGSWYHLQADDVGHVPGEEDGDPHGAHQIVGVDYYPRAVAAGDDLVVIGEVPFDQLGDDSDVATFGVMTEVDYRDQGFGVAVVSAATEWVLNQGAVAWYGAYADNIPSLRIARRLGFQLFLQTIGA